MVSLNKNHRLTDGGAGGKLAAVAAA